MSLGDTRYLNPGGKTSFRAVFPHSWIGFLNRVSQVRILPGPLLPNRPTMQRIQSGD